MGLKQYRQKRNFAKTKEPAGKKRASHQKGLEFVVQEHHATHLHWDFRLEAEGVLKSWAVPKGPSLNPSEKRLAVQVEDHPFEYRTFEGTIPKGSYGAGTVKIWDHGTYFVEGASTPQESEALIKKGLHEGRLNFILKGKKLKGAFSLIRFRGAKSKQWLLIKKKDPYASTAVSNEAPLEKQKELTLAAKTSTKIPHVKPMLATLVDEPFDHKDWLFEIKWDGYRALGQIQKNQVHLYSRYLQSFDHRFPELLKELNLIKVDALLDGEIVVFDEEEKPSFQLVQNYQRTRNGTLIYYVFDLLYVEGYDIRHLPLIQRKKLLKKLLPKTAHLRYCDHVQEKGKEFFQAALSAGLEGIIAKQMQSPYQEGRSKDWLKIKTHQRQEAIICGFTPPKGGREKFGSLLLGVYEGGELICVGHTGSGFGHKTLNHVYERLKPLVQSECPFSTLPKLHSPVTWVSPEIVCEVKFSEWTQSGNMRQAVFLEIREDKKAGEVVREKKVSSQGVVKKHSRSSSGKLPLLKRKDSSLELTHLDKIYWPEEGYTKGDLINYYQQVAPLILPHLKDRAETLRRYPNGIDGKSFYQKGIDHTPPWLRTEIIQHEDHDVRYLVIQDERSLLYTVNLGCIDLNPFNSRLQSLEYPDYLIIDLDPEGVVFDAVIEVARTVYQVLQKWKIPSVCKTSGATGMHIYIPMKALYTFKEVRQFAQMISQVVYEQLPDLTSLERSPAKRRKKVYLDYLQNGFGQTVAAPYSVRPLPGAPVSTPLKWSEVKPGLNPTDFTIQTVLKRFKKLGDLFKILL